MDITCISDLHGYYPELEGGDLLIVAGDLTARDEPEQYDELNDWLPFDKYKKIIIIAGNHDNLTRKDHTYLDPGVIYLQDSGTEFEGLKIWGSPWTTTFEGMNPNCKAFTVVTEEELDQKWSMIPEDIDILITHSPPLGIYDGVPDYHTGTFRECGSRGLHNRIISDYFPNLRLHVFGHIHEHGGKMLDTGLTKLVNASIVNEYYQHVNKPVRVIL